MRRIALVNQKGGVGKTTTTVNLGAALAEKGRRVVLVDLDPQANLTAHLGLELGAGDGPTIYSVLTGQATFAEALRPTSMPGLEVVPTNLDLSGAELELAAAMGRELLLRDALEEWITGGSGQKGAGKDGAPVDYVLIDCPPSLGLLSINALAASDEVFIALQTHFFALQGLSKLIDVVQLIKKRIHPGLRITGIIPCLYDHRLRLAREVLGEIRKYFPDEVFSRQIGTNVKLAEAPSYGQTILAYAPESAGARDYRFLAEEVIAQEPPSDDLAERVAAAGAEVEVPRPAPARAASKPKPPKQRSRQEARPPMNAGPANGGAVEPAPIELEGGGAA